MSKELKKFERAWKEFKERFEGAFDGVSKTAEEGSALASRDEKVFEDIEKIIKEIEEEYNLRLEDEK